ncbi:T9SS type A sorting domain-containing protein [bacterium]|nr:T9SS type A sorting domain-containing protein [bacterium]
MLLVVIAFCVIASTFKANRADYTPLNSSQTIYPNSYAKDMQIDAPWFIKSDTVQIPVQFIIRDADVIDLEELQGLYIEVPSSRAGYDFTNTDTVFSKVYDPVIEDMSLAPWDTIVFIPVPTGYTAGHVLYIKGIIDFEDGLPWDESFSKVLAIKIGTAEMPKMAHWYAGDAHFHTSFTVNPYEFGGTFRMLFHCSRAMGIDFVTTTDHASDSCIILGIIVDDLNQSDWLAIPDSIAIYGNHNPIIIRGEEAEIQTYTSFRNHLLIYGNNEFFSAPLPDGEAERDHGDVYAFLAASPEAVAYAAHPYDQDYIWANEIIDSGIKMGVLKGLQIWNERSVWDIDVDMDSYCNPFPFSNGSMLGEEGHWDEDLLMGLETWDYFLWTEISDAIGEPPRKIFIDGGSDAHGDFNYFTYHPFIMGVPSPDVYATDNAFAKVRTMAYCPEGSSQEAIMNALRKGSTIATDGPIAVLVALNNHPSHRNKLIIGQSDTLIYGSNDSLYIIYKNTSDFGGPIEQLTLKRTYPGVFFSDSISLDSFITGLEGSFRIPVDLPIEEGWCCYRLEARTFNRGEQYIYPGSSYRCFTNPIWFYVQRNHLFASDDDNSGNLKLKLNIFPNPFNISCIVSTLKDARVEIFDILGEKVATLTDGERQWIPGKEIRSGVYLFRAQLGIMKTFRKAVLIK